jgi:hypothetical protein
MSQSRTVTLHYPVHVRFPRQQRELCCGTSKPTLSSSPGRIPRLARLMALAIRLETLLQEGIVANQAELARLGHVTPARLTQILSLRQLAPDIQEEVLFLPPTQQGRAALTERQIRPLLGTLRWSEQRRQWAGLKGGIDKPTAPELPGRPSF